MFFDLYQNYRQNEPDPTTDDEPPQPLTETRPGDDEHLSGGVTIFS